ncbi:MAG: hypothetical protein AB8B93_12010 [Pseudomonadales bacterium]
MTQIVEPGEHPLGGIALQFDLHSDVPHKSPSWQFAGRELCFYFLPPKAPLSIGSQIQFAKVIIGRLEQPALGCFAAPFAVRSTRLDTEVLRAGAEGALFALLTEQDEVGATLSDMGQAQFTGPLADKLVWRTFEERFSAFMDDFNGLDCHMMDGMHLLDGNGDKIVYVNIWSCGKGVDLTTHNHGRAPSEAAPAFAEVHWVLEAATPLSGMYRTAEPGHAERSRTPMGRGDEHGPYFEVDADTRLPRLRDNGAVTYGWHGWQGGQAESAESGSQQAYDLVAAFEIEPRYALV